MFVHNNEFVANIRNQRKPTKSCPHRCSIKTTPNTPLMPPPSCCAYTSVLAFITSHPTGRQATPRVVSRLSPRVTVLILHGPASWNVITDMKIEGFSFSLFLTSLCPYSLFFSSLSFRYSVTLLSSPTLFFPCCSGSRLYCELGAVLCLKLRR